MIDRTNEQIKYPDAQSKSGTPGDDGDDEDGELEYFMVKRPPTGLLAKQLEFPSCVVAAGSSGAAVADDDDDDEADEDDENLPGSRDAGRLTHVFSHVRHFLHVLVLDGEGLGGGGDLGVEGGRWISVREMRDVEGVTSAVGKIIKLVAGGGKKEKEKEKEAKGTKKEVEKKKGK